MTFAWLVCISLIAISTSRPCEGGELLNSVTKGTIKLLFGDLWSFDQFCGQNLTGMEKAQEDFVYLGLYNGSRLESISNLKHPVEIQRGFNELILTGARARSSISIICSITSWGYADETPLQLSNAMRDNSTGCWSSLNGMLSLLRISSGRRDIVMQNGARTDPDSQGQAIDSFANDWLELNAFGRINQGYPFDSHIWLGDYKACKRLPRTRYCLGAVRSSSWLKIDSDYDFVRIGLCLPTECGSSSFSDSDRLTSVLEQILAEYNPGMRTSFSLGHLTDVHCLPEDDSPLRSLFGDPLRILLILAAALWIKVVIYATLFHQQTQTQSKATSRILKSFNLADNLSKFVRTKTDTDGLAGLNFIKVAGILWLMSSHNLILAIPYLRNHQEFRLAANSSPLAMIILQAQHGVIAFFLISGLLVGYKYLVSNKRIHFTKMVVARYARLAPLYLFAYAFVKEFAHLMSSGPLWDYGISSQSEIRQCMKESWLVPILMLANFIPPFAHCILTGWHIANDFHSFLLIPLLLKIYQQSRKSGRLIVITSFTLSHLFHFWNFYKSDNFNYETLTREPFTIGTRTLMERLANDYVNPIGRFGTYFLGVLLADMVLQHRASIKLPHQDGTNRGLEISMIRSNYTEPDCNERAGRDSKEPANSRDKIFVLAAIVSLFFCLVGPALPIGLKEILNPYSKWLTYPLIRLVNELSWFYIIYYVLKKQEPHGGQSETSHLMGLPIWDVVVKLNYTLVVIHFTVARYFIQSQTQLLNFSWPNLIQIISFNVLATYCVAFFMHLVVEVPLMSIVREILISLKIDTEPKRPKEVGYNSKSVS